MALDKAMLARVIRAAMPWSAVHVVPGKLVSMSENVYELGGFRGRFKKGDIIFGHTVFEGKIRPVIYSVALVFAYDADPTIDIMWILWIIGGYGPKKIEVSWGEENPSVMYRTYFRDWDAAIWRPNLNYFADKIVRDGKTIWDVGQALREA